MRLDKVYIDGFKNLKDFSIDFDETCLTTVVIGQNGSGKSNLIEAIVWIFRWFDQGKVKPRFLFRLEYLIGTNRIVLSNLTDAPAISVDGNTVSKAEFDRRKRDWFPDLVFGYYSGTGRRLESLFDDSLTDYYKKIATNQDESTWDRLEKERRLFYCRPIHGVMALLSFYAYPSPEVVTEIENTLGVTGFHSALVHFREPWFKKKGSKPETFWGALGPAGKTANLLQKAAFHPMALKGNAIDDYRDKKSDEDQYAVFLPSLEAIDQLVNEFIDDRDFFSGLESLDISDLIREIFLWVKRTNDGSGDVGFSDLSDGERQLLMVMGLIRVSRGKRALFLLDEPDTHLNPHWQREYLSHIQKWAGLLTSDEKNCQFIMTSHNPLTISALQRNQVRIVCNEPDGRVSATAPYTDPRGMGFTATLTEIFGLPTTLDEETQKLVDERNILAQVQTKTDEQAEQLILLNDRLARFGYLFEDREPLYQEFLRAWQGVKYSDRPLMTPSKIKERHEAMKALLREMTKHGGQK